MSSASTRQIDVVIDLLLLDFDLVRGHDDQGFQYVLNRRVEGVDIDLLKEGDLLRCTVTVKMPRVLRAEVIA